MNLMTPMRTMIRRWSARPGDRVRVGRGITLAEVVVASVVVGVMLVAALSTVGASRRARDGVVQRQRAYLLADALLSEIASQPYEDADDKPGSRGATLAELSPGNRSRFNDLNDYAAWTASPPQRKDGSEVPSAGGWSEAVSIEYLDPSTLAVSGTDLGLARVTVALSDRGAVLAELTAIRTRGLAECEACCLPKDVCRMLPAEECKLFSGVPAGSGTTCWTNTCNASLIGHWLMDAAGGLIADDNVLGHDGVLINGPTWISGKVGNSVKLDGTNDYVEIANQADLSITGELSITAWIYKTSNSGVDVIMHKGSTGTNYCLETNGTRVVFTFFTAMAWDCTSTFTLTANAWYHVAATYNDAKDEVKLYLNGVLRTTVACAGSMVVNSEPLFLGRDTGMTSMYAGRLDEVRLYGKTLSDSEVLAVYNGTAP